MRFAVDVREACRPDRTGKGQWTRGFVSELLGRGVDVELYTDADVPDAWKNATIKRIDRRGLGWHLAVADDLKNRNDLDAYVSPTSYIVPAIAAKSVRTIPVVHDLIAFRDEPHNKKAVFIERLTLKHALRKSAHVLTVSASAKEDLVRNFPSIDEASITPIFAGPMQTSVLPSQEDGKTVLCVATLSPRKNQLGLIKAYASLSENLRSQFKLKLVGARGWNDDEIVSLATSTPGVEWRGYVSDDEYKTLLSTCTVFALPSFYEGFGMQILDAMQRGIPVLTSDRGSLKEVAGNAAMVVDPSDVESIAKGLGSLLSDASLRQRLRGAGQAQAATFSWKRTVDLFLDAINRLPARSRIR